MSVTCYVTLEKRNGDKILVSPCFPQMDDGFRFLHELLEDLGYFLRFYPYKNKYTYYNDDFILALEPEEDCLELEYALEETPGLRILDLSLEKVLNFIEEKQD